jgi:hypothetical protein
LGDAEDVELAAEWGDSRRKAGDWFNAVLKCGWVDEVEPGRYEIHDLLDHAPDYVRKRAYRHEQRKDKGLRRKTADTGGQRQASQSRQSENGGTPAPAPAPAPSPKEKPLPDGSASGVVAKPKSRKEHMGDHAEFIAHFVSRWEELYGAKYSVLAKDGVAAARILKIAGSRDEASAIANRYLASDDEYLAKHKHPLTLLLNQINRFTADARNAGGKGAGDADPDTFVAVRPNVEDLPWNRGGGR